MIEHIWKYKYLYWTIGMALQTPLLVKDFSWSTALATAVLCLGVYVLSVISEQTEIK